MADAMIEVRGLYRRFGEGEQAVTVLNNIDLQIAAGEMVAIIGASGSGKSTLMNILGCLDRPSAGEYWLDGDNTANLSSEARARLRREHIGFIFQRYHLLADLSARENVAIPSVYAGVSSEQGLKRADELLSRLGLASHTHHKPSQLSGGQQQRVSIARALMNGGKIIFADEPTGALDSQSGEEVMAILRELHQAGHTIILVTHDPHIAASADRTIEIKDGEIIADSAAKVGVKASEPEAPLRAARLGLSRYFAAFSMAWRAIIGHKLRAFLTMLGIVIGIASVVSVVALGQGAQQQVLSQISDLGSNTIHIYPGKFGDRRAWRIRTLTAEDADVLAEQSFIDSATPNVSRSTNSRYNNLDLSARVEGVGAQYFQVQNRKIVRGRSFNSRDIERYAAVAVIDQTGAKRLFREKDPLGEVILLKNMAATVVGVVEDDKSQFSANSLNVYAPYTSVMNRLLGQNHVNTITLRIADGVASGMAEDAIKRILIRRHGAEDFSLLNADSLREAITNTTRTLSLLISAIALISLIVGGIGVMNIMLVSVTERTQEIGIRMAVGARQSDILRQFLIEAVLLCLIGGVLGIALAFGLGQLLSVTGADFEMIYSTASIVAAFVCATGIGILFGFLPARNAARLDPVDALARE
ncbi:MacB family efflux pump subunit [Suttonella sp. R2A3]|uniref:MacB family efflux pump subunit n=1 Tax=Suttonella sp. R2A3 TaxID=2908648 RepID=UPI001F3A0174|nr:MacB family efflux pump subunit [Suttonella sp. R2A3]UJF23779.1 MacB family efflux pump subunit [Suttonella sp. R2A3]